MPSASNPNNENVSEYMEQPEAGVTKKFDHPFRLDESKLRKISEILDDYSKKLGIETDTVYRIAFEDRSYYHTYDIEEILREPNSKKRLIVFVSVKILSKTPLAPSVHSDRVDNLLAVVMFNAQKKVALLVIDARDRGWCFSLSEELGTHIDRCLKHKNKLISRPNIFDKILAASVVLAIFVVFNFIFKSEGKFEVDYLSRLSVDEKLNLLLETQASNSTALPFAAAAAAIAVGSALAIIFSRPFKRLSSFLGQSWFLWGDAIDRHKNFESKINRIKWSIVVAFLISLSAGFIVAYFIK